MIDVSVIIPVYNTEKYLNDCIDSILNQFGVSLEIILIDDGSTDSSAIICDSLAFKYPNIKTIHIKNSGPATAKNEGLELAQGNYIALIDSDDTINHYMFYKMTEVGYENDADIICCNYKQIDEKGHITHFNYTNKIYTLSHEDGLIHFFSKDKIYSQCWTKLYKRKMLITHNIKNDPGLRTDEDFIFNIRAFLHAQKTIIIDEPLYNYTHRQNSLAHSYYKKDISTYIDNRIRRVIVTQEAVENESITVKEWSIIHIIMYYNELLGKVALFPTYYTDKRIIEILKYIKQHKSILNKHYKICGFSKIGEMLILYLPHYLYMRYRKTKK